MAEPEKLSIAIKNVIENAVKYSKDEGGKVTVEVTSDRKKLYINVIDTGVGIPQKDLPKIFDRFYRGDNAYKGANGSGLGLSMVKKIIEEHNGDIRVTSKKGQGTTVKISIPRA